MTDFHVRPAAEDDIQGIARISHQAATFGSSLSAMATDEVGIRLKNGPAFVAIQDEKTVVGMLLTEAIGTRRLALTLAVNPALRRRGIATALMAEVPEQRRLLVTSNARASHATAFLRAQGFTERHRVIRLRRALTGTFSSRLPSWASIVTTDGEDAQRYLAVGSEAFDHPPASVGAAQALLNRPGTRLLYLQTPEGDQGIAHISPLARAKRNERTNDRPDIGTIAFVGIKKACRGKKLSHPLILAALAALQNDGYAQVEVGVDERRQRALQVFEQDSFARHGEDIEWMRKDDE